jgi:hypothetical protein
VLPIDQRPSQLRVQPITLLLLMPSVQAMKRVRTKPCARS